MSTIRTNAILDAAGGSTANINGDLALNRSTNINLGSATSTTSGTSVEITGIPSWVKRATVSLRGVSTTGTTVPYIQLGTSTAYLTTGYSGAASAVVGGVSLNAGAGWPLLSETAAGASVHGAFTILKIESNIWEMSGVLGRSDGAQTLVLGGTVDLAGTLTRLRLIIAGGQAFDAGSLGFAWE